MVEKLNMIQQLSEAQQARSNIVVAASGLTMADGQSQDPMRSQVRLRNGEYVYVKDLPTIDTKNRQPNGDYLIPLVTDHTGKVKEQVGAAWLFIENDMLHALVVWTNNQIANDIKPLADDGFLQFSTEGYVDNIDDNGKYGDFWISTLSPVTVGNDPATQVLNQHKKVLIANAFSSEIEGEIMANKKVETKKDNEVTDEERESIIAEAVAQAVDAITSMTGEDTEDVVENDTDETESDETPDADESDDETEEEKGEEVTTNKVRTTPKTKVSNQTPKQNIVRVNESHADAEEIKAFSNALAQATRNRSGEAGVRAAMEVYNAKVGHKTNIIGGDTFVPTSLAVTFFKAWLDNENMKFVKFMNARAGAVYAATTDDTALDHTKGDPTAAKIDQELDLVRRDLKALAVYKRLPIDAQDLFDDHDGNLMKFRTQELSARIANQILKAIVLGGNTPGSVGSTIGGGTRGVFGIVPDAAAVSGFGTHVASEVAGTNGEDPYSAVIRTLDAIAVTNGGNITSAGLVSTGITLIVPTGWISSILLSKNNNDNYQFTRDNINALLGISGLVMMPELVASQSIVAVADGAYQLFGENSPKMYPFFDTVYNQDVLLAEQMVAGSLAGYKQAAVYSPFEES